MGGTTSAVFCRIMNIYIHGFVVVPYRTIFFTADLISGSDKFFCLFFRKTKLVAEKMEGKGQMGSSSSSSSSFTADLFGTREPQPSPSTGIFASIFPPPSKVLGRGNSQTKQGSSTRRNEAVRYNIPNKEKSSMFPEERAEPCHLSSSLYYGGQDVYSRSPSNQSSESYPTIRKNHQGEDDANGNNSQDASRGNWWQGSLYY